MSVIADLLENFAPLLGVVGTIFWVWMLIDCMSRAKARPQRGWLFLLILFSHWVGALIYFFIYVYPLNRLFQSAPTQPPQSAPQKPFIYYTPPNPSASTSQTYQNYQQGYQPRSVPTPAPTSVTYSQEDQAQSLNPIFDYEEPHSTYPELPPQQQ